MEIREPEVDDAFDRVDLDSALDELQETWPGSDDDAEKMPQHQQ